MQESAVNYTVWSYVIYLAVSVGMTIWVAHTLHRNGRVFLVDAMGGNEQLAGSVNHLLVVGFYLINLGYISLMLKLFDKPTTLQGAFEFCSFKVGLVMLILGVMHFFNLYIFSAVRRRAMLRNAEPPVLPSGYLVPEGRGA